MTDRNVARVAAPAAFLAGVTIAALLVRAGLEHHPAASTTTTTVAATTHRTTTHAKKQAAPKPGGVTVTVQSGDTFYAIATKAGISVDRLKALNPGVDPYALHVGERIRVK